MILNVFKSIFINAYKFIQIMLSGVMAIFVMIISGSFNQVKAEEDKSIDNQESLFLNIESDKFKKNLAKNINILKDIDRKNC